MGFRTVVILNNDLAHEWEKDPDLGQKISHAMNRVGYADSDIGNYGNVVECVHADTQTIAVVDGFALIPLAHTGWHPNQNSLDMQIALVKDAAAKLGFNLVKRRAKNG